MLTKRSLNAAIAALLCLCMTFALIPVSTAQAAVETETAEKVKVVNNDGKKSRITNLNGHEDIAYYTVTLQRWDGTYDKNKTDISIVGDTYGDCYANVYIGGSDAKPVAYLEVWGTGEHSILLRETFYNKAGKAKHHIEYTVTVTLRAPKIIVGGNPKRDNVVTYLNKTAQLSTEFTAGDITWTSTKEKVATVDEQGVVTGHKMGRCYIKATTTSAITNQPITLSCCVEVTYKKACKAVNNALSDYDKGTLQYSQDNRMGANYRDCSSFVGRAYSRAGMLIGSESWVKSWALPASDQAIWLKAKGVTVSESAVAFKKLLPGDLIYYSYSGLEGIYHVAMYAGNGRVIHVSDYNPGNCVRYRYSTRSSDAKAALKVDEKIVYIGRPCK